MCMQYWEPLSYIVTAQSMLQRERLGDVFYENRSIKKLTSGSYMGVDLTKVNLVCAHPSNPGSFRERAWVLG